jgi:hypothetical protein
MTSFSPVASSRIERREFRLTAGLRAGYGSAGAIFDVGQAIRSMEHWLIERKAQGLPVVTGMITKGEIIYAGGDTALREPVAIFSGEIHPSSSPPTDDEVESALDSLAGALAEALQQEEIAVAYRNCIWIVRARERDGKGANA